MANEKKRGLGKGISSLMSGFDFDSQTDDIITKTIKDERKDKMTVVQLDIGHVRPNPNQPRKYFDEEALSGLAESIKSQGIIQPLTVEEIAPGEFSIIAGERRYRAAKIAGLEKIPAIVVNINEIQRIQMSLIENIQRENLNAIEEATAYQYLIDHSGFTQEMVSQKVGKSRSAIANSLRLLSLSDKEQQYTVAMKIFDEKLSVRETEKLVKSITNPVKKAPKKELKNDFVYRDIEEKLKQKIGTKVTINRKTEQKGKIEIEYYSPEELEKILAYFK